MEVVNKIEMKKISEIRPYIRNPRKNDKTVKLLVDIIPKVGFNVPILIDSNGIIVKGHARYNAAIKLGMKEVPCVVTYADEEAIKLDRIADNRISEFSEWLNEGLMHELDTLTIDFSGLEFDMPSPIDDDMGFTPEDSSVSDEDKQRKYQEYAEAHSAPAVEMTTQQAIEKAEQKQAKTAEPTKEYYKCVCEKCGHIMFVDKSALWKSSEN